MRQIEDRVSHQDFIVKVHDVEPDYQIRAKQLLNQIVDSFLRIDPVFVQTSAVGDSKGHPHVPFFVPTADVVRGALSFKIEVDDVHASRFWVLRFEFAHRGFESDYAKRKTQNAKPT